MLKKILGDHPNFQLSRIIIDYPIFYLLRIYLRIKYLKIRNYFLLKDTARRMLFNNNNFNVVLTKDNFQIYSHFYTNLLFKLLFL